MTISGSIDPNRYMDTSLSVTPKIESPKITDYSHITSNGVSLWDKLGSMGSLFSGLGGVAGAASTFYASNNAKMISAETIRMQRTIAEKELALDQARLESEHARLLVEKEMANRQLALSERKLDYEASRNPPVTKEAPPILKF